MPRKAASPASEDSQKENHGLRGRKDSDKMAQQQNAKGKGIARRQIVSEDETREIVEDDDEREGEEEDEENEENEDASPKGRKRVRINEEGDSRPVDDDVEPVKKERIRTLPRDVDGFVPGSIVRIQLKNFVTYDFVEFCPGPYLNLIFGPNGTGKSTIACAICLGLNFPPSVLGRATDLNSFVKIGTNSGHIEIELKGSKGKPNLTIRRTLSAKSKSSNFFLNGQAASGREIQNRMAELNVQVSNLCTFLPQDKVSEFAQMSPQQLLRETQRAAGNASLTTWHDALISSGKDLKQLQELLNSDTDQLKTAEERNAALEREVKRFEERRQLEREVQLYELILPFREYVEAKNNYTVAKATQREALARVKKLQERNKPISERKEAIEAQIAEYESLRDDKKKTIRRKYESIARKTTESEKKEMEAETLTNKLENLKNLEKTRLREINKCEKAIAQFQHQLDNPPEIEDVDAINTEMRKVNQEKNKLANEISEIQDKQKAVIAEESRFKAVVDENTHYLQQLEDVSHQKLDALSRGDQDCGDAVRWLRANKHRFKMDVFEPPTLCVTVPDPRYADAVEACFGSGQLRTFVAQCEEDYQLLNRLLVDTPEAIGRKARLHTWYKNKDESQLPPPPISEQEMRELGFDGYAIDYVNCPEGLRWFLTSNMNMHRTAIALDPNAVDARRAMDMVSRTGPEGGGGGASYIVGHVFNSVTRSRYGKRLPQNSTRMVKPARNLVSATVDQSLKERYERAIEEARRELSIISEQMQVLGEEDAGIRSQSRELKRQTDGLQARKDHAQRLQQNQTTLTVKIERARDELQKLLNRPSVDEERARLKIQLLKVARERADIAQQCLALMRDVIKDQAEATRLGLHQAQAAANKAALEVLFEEKEAELAKALAVYQEANKAYEVAKQDSKAKLELSKEKLESVDDELRDRFREMEHDGQASAMSAEQVRAELETKQAQLEMNLHTNGGVVEQYKKRQAEIAALTRTIEDRQKKVLKLERSIKAARDNWQPALEELVTSIGQKFSAAFDRLGCAGEVRIHEHEDYDKWTIDILVKFRDEEKLQLLTGERQSGGERSLTTILYLMSLTEEARAPFSLVDEINQGMDRRAERAVHNALVDVTCKEDSGQYFLITPKLLPDLKYAERMKVLCVNNGEWLPEEISIGNMMSLIEGYVQHNRGRSASSM
ncbi:nucleoside triphosphate hydrolase protein [Wolfiporia cocos MD-104 SS10]|uniref:Structural maintenance of chromosomes protein 5 n=1 Tax=Wolfiporia cocos (strain MD-104) TaxID=742152 RepID=A0A2H3JEV1_WOLCO|nr:nucleoside triphosphate hydrolase protein [Wolfiporia cocos MD-104 SS10]